MRSVWLALLIGVLPLAASAASLEQRLEKVERQMSRLTVLMMEMQDLRADLQENYGAVEEMVHQLEQLKKQQRSQYLDLDQRLQALESNKGAGSKGAARKSQSVPPSADAGSRGGSELKSYNKAFALVRANKNKEALAAFKRFIKQFPKGEYIGDAWYWSGRLHRVNGDEKSASKAFSQAKTIFKRIVKNSPNSPQAERAVLKLKNLAK